MARVHVLGELRVDVGGERIELPTSRKARLLLGILATERRRHGRSELAGRLWSDVREDSARTSLRTALVQLRGALGPAADAVIADMAGSLALAAGVATDLDEVDDLLSARDVEAALERCAQPLLAGFDEDWVHQRRDELRNRLVEAATAAAAAAEGAGDLDGAIRLSRRLTTLDPLAESVHRDLIRRLAAAGDRAAALTVFERFRERLATELRVAPSEATRALVAQVRAEAPAPAPGDEPNPARPEVGPSRVRYTSSGGRAIAYQRFGTGPADLLVVPGWTSNLDAIWSFPPLGPLFTALGGFARCTVFDKRGTGLSDRDLGFGSVEERVEDVLAVFDTAGLERASLFAYSESAALAMAFAAAHPDRVERLILYSAYARLLAGPGYDIGFPPAAIEQFVEYIARDWGRGAVSRVSFDAIPATASAEAALERWERSVCTPTMAAHIIRANADIDVRPLLASVRAPTLVLHSAGDPIAPAALGRYVAEHIPSARFVEHDAPYHLPWDGASAWFVPAIEEFLAAPAASPAPAERFLSTVLSAAGLTAGRSSREEIRRCGGQEFPTADDGGALLAIFDSPSRALQCASALQRASGAGARIAVHTGEVQRAGEDLDGPGLQIAHEIRGLAGPGEVLVSRMVRDLTADSGARLEHDERRAGAWELFRIIVA